ncbi:MAG: hypothetical protein JRL30_00850 [Deltaproteobacteria bacterium]|nr:hypothetical protein [Deltaproteobacteria bacterium]
MSVDAKTHHEKCWTYHRRCLEGKLRRFAKAWMLVVDDGEAEVMALAAEIDAALLERDDRIAELELEVKKSKGTLRAQVAAAKELLGGS